MLNKVTWDTPTDSNFKQDTLTFCQITDHSQLLSRSKWLAMQFRKHRYKIRNKNKNILDTAFSNASICNEMGENTSGFLLQNNVERHKLEDNENVERHRLEDNDNVEGHRLEDKDNVERQAGRQ